MSKKTLFVLAAVFSLGAVFSVLAQSQSQSQSQSAPPSLPSNSLDNQGTGRYRLGPGDLLDVRVFGQSDLNSTVEIDEAGNISSLPFIEVPIPAKCHNEREVQKAITEAYAKYIVRPRVSVRVLERRSRPPATVFGAVRSAARIQMNRRVRLHELLANAGGITLGASGTIQIIHTEPIMCPEQEDIAETVATSLSNKPAETSASNKPAETSASNKPVEYSTSEKLPGDSGSDIGRLEIYQINNIKSAVDKDDPFIRPGDIVIVTEGEPIYVLGSVGTPRELIMKDGLTLTRALAMVGGPTRLAKVSDIHIRRKGKGGDEDLKINYEAIKKGQQPDVLLKPFDIIEVREVGAFSGIKMADFFGNMAKGTVGSLPQRAIIY